MKHWHTFNEKTNQCDRCGAFNGNATGLQSCAERVKKQKRKEKPKK